MKQYPISESSTETIVFKVDEERYALVHKLISGKFPFGQGEVYKTIILNRREALKLYQAISEAVLNKK